MCDEKMEVLASEAAVFIKLSSSHPTYSHVHAPPLARDFKFGTPTEHSNCSPQSAPALYPLELKVRR